MYKLIKPLLWGKHTNVMGKYFDRFSIYSVLILIFILPYFVFRSDQEFYLSGILWGKAFAGSLDFLLGKGGMQNLSILINIFSELNFNPYLKQILLFALYILCISIIWLGLLRIYRYVFAEEKVFTLLLPWLLIVNPQSGFSSNRFITDNLHPRLASLACLVSCFVFILENRSYILTLIFWTVALFVHPISALLLVPLLLYFLFVRPRDIQSKVYIILGFVSSIVFYLLYSKMSGGSGNAGVFDALTPEWQMTLDRVMPFIFPGYFVDRFNINGVETLSTIVSIIALRLLCERVSGLFKISVGTIFLIITVFALGVISDRIIFYQLQPVRLFGLLHIILVMMVSLIVAKVEVAPWRRVVAFLIFVVWIILRPSEVWNYQIYKIGGAFLVSMLFFFYSTSYLKEKYKLFSIIFIGIMSFSISWADGKIYEIFGKSLFIAKYNEWPELVQLIKWVKLNTAQSDLFAWQDSDYRSGLFRLVAGRPVFVTYKDGGIVLYSKRQSIEWSERIKMSSREGLMELKRQGVRFFVTSIQISYVNEVYKDSQERLFVYDISN